ncbi:MAG: tail fiber protein [Clostridia bacterium]|nr:tail fiber protein [Clostridia bacterium]
MAFNKRVMFGMDDVVSKVIEKLQDLLMPSGCICYFKRSTPPNGWAICDGSVVSMRDGSRITTPNLIGRYPLGSTTDVGTAVSAGLPNITGYGGYTEGDRTYTVKTTGAFVKGGKSPLALTGAYTSSGYYNKIEFNASNSNSIYGNSSTVTPPSVKLLPCMKL